MTWNSIAGRHVAPPCHTGWFAYSADCHRGYRPSAASTIIRYPGTTYDSTSLFSQAHQLATSIKRSVQDLQVCPQINTQGVLRTTVTRSCCAAKKTSSNFHVQLEQETDAGLDLRQKVCLQVASLLLHATGPVARLSTLTTLASVPHIRRLMPSTPYQRSTRPRRGAHADQSPNLQSCCIN
jgi:hypothetical protein